MVITRFFFICELFSIWIYFFCSNISFIFAFRSFFFYTNYLGRISILLSTRIWFCIFFYIRLRTSFCRRVLLVYKRLVFFYVICFFVYISFRLLFIVGYLWKIVLRFFSVINNVTFIINIIFFSINTGLFHRILVGNYICAISLSLPFRIFLCTTDQLFGISVRVIVIVFNGILWGCFSLLDVFHVSIFFRIDICISNICLFSFDINILFLCNILTFLLSVGSNFYIDLLRLWSFTLLNLVLFMIHRICAIFHIFVIFSHCIIILIFYIYRFCVSNRIFL